MANILDVQNLAKNYGDFQAVKGISFDINAGTARPRPARRWHGGYFTRVCSFAWFCGGVLYGWGDEISVRVMRDE